MTRDSILGATVVVAALAVFAGSVALSHGHHVRPVSAAQQTQYACPAGTVVGSQLANTGQQCVSIPTGPQGVRGPSAYDLAVSGGYSGTVSAWLQSLVGATGPAGVQGVQGVAGQVGNSGPAGVAGVAGVAGPQGIAGIAATITVGTVTQTLAYGATPTVTNSGTSSAAVLNFNYPSFTVPVASTTFPASVLLGLNTTTQAVSMSTVPAGMAVKCAQVGSLPTGASIDLTQSYAVAGTVYAILKNNAVLSTSTAAISVRCEIF